MNAGMATGTCTTKKRPQGCHLGGDSYSGSGPEFEGEGRKDPLPESLPPKNRACDFHRTRLKHNKSFVNSKPASPLSDQDCGLFDDR